MCSPVPNFDKPGHSLSYDTQTIYFRYNFTVSNEIFILRHQTRNSIRKLFLFCLWYQHILCTCLFFYQVYIIFPNHCTIKPDHTGGYIFYLQITIKENKGTRTQEQNSILHHSYRCSSDGLHKSMNFRLMFTHTLYHV